MVILEPWVITILADPITKVSIAPDHFPCKNGVLDARVFLKNTYGYTTWAEGQNEYEAHGVVKSSVEQYQREIEYDRPVYAHYTMNGRILDSGGGAGTVREFLPPEAEFISVDPWDEAPFEKSVARKQAYSCLNRPVNFIAAASEFLPFISQSFDWVHMRSMLDHVQTPDLALLEAGRVLRPEGRLLIGTYVEGGKSGIVPTKKRAKDLVKAGLAAAGINRWKDHHVWHPTYKALTKLVSDNGFVIDDTYWQPQWNDMVCYVCARRAA